MLTPEAPKAPEAQVDPTARQGGAEGYSLDSVPHSRSSLYLAILL